MAENPGASLQRSFQVNAVMVRAPCAKASNSSFGDQPKSDNLTAALWPYCFSCALKSAVLDKRFPKNSSKASTLTTLGSSKLKPVESSSKQSGKGFTRMASSLALRRATSALSFSFFSRRSKTSTLKSLSVLAITVMVSDMTSNAVPLRSTWDRGMYLEKVVYSTSWNSSRPMSPPPSRSIAPKSSLTQFSTFAEFGLSSSRVATSERNCTMFRTPPVEMALKAASVEPYLALNRCSNSSTVMLPPKPMA
mmetsp:Transcript_2856/g.6296  ORF Transcript_2856/g.6296 Transcript_2856/m.6296 type:complete len:250 (+) Transcript_2856:116-865(+)